MNIFRILNITDIVFFLAVVAFFSYGPLRRHFFNAIKMTYRGVRSRIKDTLINRYLKAKKVSERDRLLVKGINKVVRQKIELIETKYGANYDINDPKVLWGLINDPKVPKEDKDILTSAYHATRKIANQA